MILARMASKATSHSSPSLGCRVLLAAALLCTSTALFAQQTAQQAVKPAPAARVGAAAVWNPAPETLAEIRKTCGETNPLHIENCFLTEMQTAGASAEALAFTKSLATMGVIYLRAIRKADRVDIAYVEYAFRANELESVLLVNGDPSPIDVDDDSYFPDATLKQNPAYAALADKYPQVSVWPDDRSDAKFPTVVSIGWGTQTFQVNYVLRDGCHACATVGNLVIAFNFDTQGKFQSARVSSVTAATPRIEPPASTGFDEAGGVEQIRVLAGKQFSITLAANHTTGYSWRLVSPLDPALLKQISNVYSEPTSGAVGASGEEVWTFESVAQGKVALNFEYVRPFEKDVKAVKTARYSVSIE
jgi:predicted secreted protein